MPTITNLNKQNQHFDSWLYKMTLIFQNSSILIWIDVFFIQIKSTCKIHIISSSHWLRKEVILTLKASEIVVYDVGYNVMMLSHELWGHGRMVWKIQIVSAKYLPHWDWLSYLTQHWSQCQSTWFHSHVPHQQCRVAVILFQIIEDDHIYILTWLKSSLQNNLRLILKMTNPSFPVLRL